MGGATLTTNGAERAVAAVIETRLHITPPVRLLVIDDEAQNLELISAALEQSGLEVLTAASPEAGLEIFFRVMPEIVLVDLMMPNMSGMEVLERVVSVDPGTEVMLMTGHYSTDSAVEAIQKGASDYFEKPIDINRLRSHISTLLSEMNRRRRALQLDNELLNAFQFEGIVGRSPLMLEVFLKVRRVAPHFRTVLLTGATGSGKELVARALHHLSPGARNPLAVTNCASIVGSLFETELFGYVKGAFTGATQDKVGLFEFANGGTVFLDEIGELPLSQQAKLLRVIQNQEVQRVGSPVVRKVDVRVVAATHHDLRALVAEKKFREDLFYRLSMVEITMPRLTDRKEDLPLLQRHMLNLFSRQYGKTIRGITRRAQNVLARYPWPGNVRELENVLGNACMLTSGEVLDVIDLPEYVRTAPSRPAVEYDDSLTLDEVQRKHANRVLEKFDGNKVKAAEAMGISRGTLYRLLNEQTLN